MVESKGRLSAYNGWGRGREADSVLRPPCCLQKGSSSKQGSVTSLLALIVVIFIKHIFSKELKALPTSNLTVAGGGPVTLPQLVGEYSKDNLVAFEDHCFFIAASELKQEL